MLALALAVTAWAYFHFSAAPSITAHFDQQLSVPIVVTGLRPGLVASYDERTAIVTVEVPRNEPPIKPDQVQAVLDLNERPEPGIMNLPVKIVAPDLVIKIALARVGDAERRPARDTDGAGEHLLRRRQRFAGRRIVDRQPSVTTVRGIANDLAKVDVVKIEIPLGTKPGSFDAMVRPIAADAHGNEVQHTQVSPTLVRVQARFAPSTNSAGVKS